MVLERFPVLQEIGFRREVMLVAASAMKDLVTSSLFQSSHDYRTFAKAALICRREIALHRSTNNRAFIFEEDGFKEQCQEQSVPESLKFLISTITQGPSANEQGNETTQAALIIAQLVYFNNSVKASGANRIETPLPLYIGMYIHSRFRSSEMVDEFARLGLSIK